MTVTRTPQPRRTGRTTTVPASFPVLLLALAGLLALNSLLGPLGLDAIDYDFSPTIESQLIGLELVTLLLVVPACVWAAVLSARGSAGGPAPCDRPVELCGVHVRAVRRRAGVRPLLARRPAAVALVSLAGGLAFWAWALSRRVALPQVGARGTRLRGWLLLGFAGFVLLRYAELFTGASGDRPIAAEYAADRTFFWSIVLLDLGVVVPVTVAAAVAVLRGSATGHRAVYGVVAWFALVPPSVTAMGLVMLARDDPDASWGTVALLSGATAVFAAVAAAIFRPLLRRR